jgi:hypothetical protein
MAVLVSGMDTHAAAERDEEEKNTNDDADGAGGGEGGVVVALMETGFCWDWEVWWHYW